MSESTSGVNVIMNQENEAGGPVIIALDNVSGYCIDGNDLVVTFSDDSDSLDARFAGGRWSAIVDVNSFVKTAATKTRSNPAPRLA